MSDITLHTPALPGMLPLKTGEGIEREDQALEFGREYFGQMLSKVLYHAPESMDDEGTESPFHPLFQRELGHALGASGAFDREAWDLARTLLGQQEAAL